MKKLFIICSLLLMVVFTVSCEKETGINESLEKSDQKNVDPTGLILDFNSEAYKESLSKPSKKSTVSSKIVDEETGLTFFLDAEEFELNNCNDLNLEDFESSLLIDSQYNNHFFGSLNSTTNNSFYSTGDIIENVSFSASLGGQIGDLAVVKESLSSVFLRTGYTDSDFTLHYLNIDFNNDNVYSVSMDLLSHWSYIFPMKIDFYGDLGLIGSTTVQDISLIPTFFGVKSITPIKKITLNLLGWGWEGIDNLAFGVCDTDGDGCYDDVDPIVNSNMEATVNIDGCDYGVINYVTYTCGITMSDMIDTLEAGTYKTHGAFVKAMAKLVNSWYYGGLITLAEKDLIMMCAGESSIGY